MSLKKCIQVPKLLSLKSMQRLDYTSNQMKGIIPLVAQPFEQSTMPAVWSTLQRYDGSGNRYSTALAGVLTALGLHA